MNTRPTPETDAFAIKFKTTCGEKYWVPVDIARKLESERDEARFDLDFRRRLGDWQNKTIDLLTRERDEWKAKFIQQNKDLGCEQMDPNGTIWDYAKKVQTELAEVTEQRGRLLEEREQWRLSSVCRELVEQRDMLAAALRIVADGTSCRECGGEDQALLAREALQSLFCDALQSLTPNEPISK